MTDESAFEVGRNLGDDPGQRRLSQSTLIELIQYAPTTSRSPSGRC